MTLFKGIGPWAFGYLLPFVFHAGPVWAEAPAANSPPLPRPNSSPAKPDAPPYKVTGLPFRVTSRIVLFELAPLGLTVSDSLDLHKYTFLTRFGFGVAHRHGSFVFGLLGEYEYSTRAAATFDAMASIEAANGLVVQAGPLVDVHRVRGEYLAVGNNMLWAARMIHLSFPNMAAEVQRRTFDGAGETTTLLLKLSYPLPRMFEEFQIVKLDVL